MKRLFIYLLLATGVHADDAYARDIVFCEERIPVHKDFVARKLMDIIKQQIPQVNLPELKRRVALNFPIVEYYLRETGLPQDFKYLAIVESAFLNRTSVAGARGFWQLMPETAREHKLIVSSTIDERDDIYKSTYAACKVLASYYLELKRKYGVSSWVLTAAAYNFGIGNMHKVINKQGNDYFSMQLNSETATYVYKIIAVKELFEYPEVYIKDFGYNYFKTIRTDTLANKTSSSTNDFASMTVNVKQAPGNYPDTIVVKELAKVSAAAEKKAPVLDRELYRYIPAVLHESYKNVEDGGLILIRLLDDIYVDGGFNRKGNVLKGKGWIVGDRVFIDMGYGGHQVVLLDAEGRNGIQTGALKRKTPVLIRIEQGE